MCLLPIALNSLKTQKLTLSLNQNRSDRTTENKVKKNPPIFIEGFVYERQAELQALEWVTGSVRLHLRLNRVPIDYIRIMNVKQDEWGWCVHPIE